MRSSWSSVIAPRGSSAPRQAGTSAGAWMSRRPSLTAMPIRAWVMLLAIDQERQVTSGPKPSA